MKKDLLKKLKYEMPGMSKGKGKGPMPMEDETEIEISMGPESADEEGMPEMMAEGEEVETEEPETEGPDLSLVSEEELMAELKKRKSKAPLA